MKFKEETPEWQLSQIIESEKLLIKAYQGDIDKAMKRVDKSLKKIETYQNALDKLTTVENPDVILEGTSES